MGLEFVTFEPRPKEIKPLPPKPVKKSRRELLQNELAPTATEVAKVLDKKRLLTGLASSLIEELVLFVAYGLRYEPDLGLYTSAVADSEHQKDPAIRRLGTAADIIWQREENRPLIFQLASNSPKPLRPTVTYGIYNLVAKEVASDLERYRLRHEPQLFYLMVS